MPNKKLEAFRVPREKGKDKRIVLNVQERKEIKLMHNSGLSIHAIAKHWEVSRRLIQFVLFPDRYERAKEIAKKNRVLNNNYYDKDKHREAVKKHRKHKMKLMKLILDK